MEKKIKNGWVIRSQVFIILISKQMDYTKKPLYRTVMKNLFYTKDIIDSVLFTWEL